MIQGDICTRVFIMKSERVPPNPLKMKFATRPGWVLLIPLMTLLTWVSEAAEFPVPEAYAEDELPQYMQAAADFLNHSPESVYAPRVAFDALVLSKDDPKFGELCGDLEVSLLLDYPRSLHGGYYQRTLGDSKTARAALERLIRHYSKKPRQDFPQKYAGSLDRLIQQCGVELIEDHGFALKSMLLLEQTEAEQLRNVLEKSFYARLKPDDRVSAFLNEATNSAIPVADRILALHKYALGDDVTAAGLRDLLLHRLSFEELQSTSIRFVRAETFLEQMNPRKAMEEYAAVDHKEFGEKELWLWSWSAARTNDFGLAQELLDELEARFPGGEYAKLAATVLKCLSNTELADDYARVLGQIIDSAANQTDSFHVMVHRRPSKDQAGCIVYLSYSSPRRDFSVLMCNSERRVVAAFHSTPDEMRGYVEGWKWIRRIQEPGFVPVPVLNLKLEEDGNSFDFHSRTVAFGNPIGCPLLDVPWFVGPAKQSETVRYFQKSGMCFSPIVESGEMRTLRCLWPSTAGHVASEWIVTVSREGRLLKVEGKEETWDVRSGVGINQPFSSPSWPKLPSRMESDSGSTFVEVFMKILKALMY